MASTAPYNRLTNTAASAITHKNGARAAILNRISKQQYPQNQSPNSTAASAITNERQGSSFIDTTDLLRFSTPTPPIPLPPQRSSPPCKAFFSPVSGNALLNSVLFEHYDRTVSNPINANNYSINISAPLATYADSYVITAINSNGERLNPNYEQTATNFNISLEGLNVQEAKTTTFVKATNRIGSSIYTIINQNPYTVSPLTNTTIQQTTTNNTATFTLQNLSNIASLSFSTSNANGTNITSYQAAIQSNSLTVNYSNLTTNNIYYTSLTAANFGATEVLLLQQATTDYSFSNSSIVALARQLAAQASAGLTSNIEPIRIGGGYFGIDYYCCRQSHTYNSSSNTYFTATEDSNSAWLVFSSNLTVASNTIIIPPVRKLFTVLYVGGNLTLNGTISMTARGAASIPGQVIQVSDSYSIAAVGGAGGNRPLGGTASAGVAGSSNQTGGGGTGYFVKRSDKGGVGAGGAGTSFSGGAASGGNFSNSQDTLAGGEFGGAGSVGLGGAGGGAGNPPNGSLTQRGSAGTGGTLIVIVEGMIYGNGTAYSQGSAGGTGYTGGGGSGGGNITFVSPMAVSIATSNVGGGAGGVGSNGRNGGKGGDGGFAWIRL